MSRSDFSGRCVGVGKLSDPPLVVQAGEMLECEGEVLFRISATPRYRLYESDQRIYCSLANVLMQVQHYYLLDGEAK